MAEQDKGLPMTAKWNPEKLRQEVAALKELEGKPFTARAGGYIKRTGPGLLQSAMTLGAGSAAASVMAGASFGYKLLWVQPVAMFLGIMMLAALGNIVLTTGERPYKAFGRELSKTLVFLWALGTIVASVVWHFPQYTLAAGAVRDLVGTVSEAQMEATTGGLTTIGLIASWLTGFLILSINIFTTWNYGSHSRGIKIYEWFLRGIIALIILSFGVVVLVNIADIQWREVFNGFFGLYGVPKVVAAPGLEPKHLDSITLVLGMLGAAVGINMTFLYPYSLLAKGWGKHHKTLCRWDLGMSMFLPFVLVTSLVIIAMTVSGVYDPAKEYVHAGMSPLDASKSLAEVMGAKLGRAVFDLGLLGMTCGAISVHMVVCGFTVCEMFGLEYTVKRYRMFTLVPAVGMLGVVFNIGSVIWFPIVASAFCFILLPIAYFIFYLLNNKESYLGEGMMKWPKRELFNVVLVVALFVSLVGSVIGLNKKVIKPIKGMLEKPAASEPAPAENPTK